MICARRLARTATAPASVAAPAARAARPRGEAPSEATGADEVTPASLHAHGLAHKGALIKVLGRGELTRAVRVSAHAFSRTAERAITEAGGTVDVVPLPFGHGRPPAKGNAITNR